MTVYNVRMRNWCILLVSLALCLAASGCLAAPRAVNDAPGLPVPPAADVFHTVLAGETVWAISRAYGVEVDAILAANQVQDVTDIPVGYRLRIPGATEVKAVPETDLYGKYRPGPLLGWPLASRRILSRFGEQRRTHRHAGLDIGGDHGEPVLAAGDGTVTHSSAMRGYGKTVIIDHGDGLVTLYGHNAALLVRVGDQVTRGQPIAKVGRTGNASTDHVHFEVHRDGIAVDPMKFVSRP